MLAKIFVFLKSLNILSQGFFTSSPPPSVPAECNIQTSPSPGIHVRHVYTPSTTKHFSPIKQSTTLTNKHRGNEVSSTPLLVHCEYLGNIVWIYSATDKASFSSDVTISLFSSIIYPSTGCTRRNGVPSE